MTNDLNAIKKEIIENDLIERLLGLAGCSNARARNNRYEAMLPDKFDSQNERAVQVYLNENLSCKVRPRTFHGTDIFDLISYLVFDCFETSEIKKCLPKSRHWICENLGFQEHSVNRYQKDNDPLAWLKEVRKKRSKELKIYENHVLDDNVLDEYILYPYTGYIAEGIEYETQLEFQIGLDIQSERIIFPIHNRVGELIGVKGRTLNPRYKTEKIPKFMHLYNVNMISELYNWHRALYYVMEKKEMIIYEAEKSCWLSSQWGLRNCVALGSSEITDWQARTIKELGLDIRIVLAFDKDKDKKEIKERAAAFGYAHQIYMMWDHEELFSANKKHSPTDLGKEAFMSLYDNHKKHRIV
ncbi:DNA primase [Paenibacillus chitinolyticus]|uniref:DNA primase n=1 Tax=Paenibacillus chitinolyticus TaxID=79263 RepID=UPI00366D69FC